MAKRSTKKVKSIIVRPTARCGENSRNFEGLGYSQIPGGHPQAAEQQAISEATTQAEESAQVWIRSMVCPVRCPIKSSSVETVEVDSNSEFIRTPARGYTLGQARVVMTATVQCKSAIKTGID